MAQQNKLELVEELKELGVTVDINDYSKRELLTLIEKNQNNIKEEEDLDSDPEPREASNEEAKPLAKGLKRVSVTKKKLNELQESGELVGYDPETEEAIVRK